MAGANAGQPNGSQADEILTYDPKPSLRYASAVGLQAAGVGALVSAIQNALGSHNKGATGFFTRSGGTIGLFGTYRSVLHSFGNCRDSQLYSLLSAAMGATFALTESIVANQRERDDHLNGVAGGCAAGFLAGIRGAFTFTPPVYPVSLD